MNSPFSFELKLFSLWERFHYLSIEILYGTGTCIMFYVVVQAFFLIPYTVCVWRCGTSVRYSRIVTASLPCRRWTRWTDSTTGGSSPGWPACSLRTTSATSSTSPADPAPSGTRWRRGAAAPAPTVPYRAAPPRTSRRGSADRSQRMVTHRSATPKKYGTGIH